MSHITRRSFLKKTAGIIVGFTVGPTVALESLAKIGATPNKSPRDTDVISLFKGEVSKVDPPLGGRIDKVEILPNPIDFSDLLRGVIKINANEGKFFAARFCRDEFLNDLSFRRAFVKDFVTGVKPFLK